MPDEKITRTQALIKLGFFQKIDMIFLVVLLLGWITFGFWALFREPTLVQLLAALLVNLALSQIWCLVLAFRCMSFVLDTLADINLMPEAAARIVAGFYASQPHATLPPPVNQP